MLAIAGGIILAVIILANLEAILALGLAALMIAIGLAIVIAFGSFVFNSSDNLIFSTLLIIVGYIIYSYTVKSEARETYLKENKIPDILVDLFKVNLGVDDLTTNLSVEKSKIELQRDCFIIEFKQVTKDNFTGFIITVNKIKSSYERTFICALHSSHIKPRTFLITSSTLVFSQINSKTNILLSVTSFCDMKDLNKLVTALTNENMD